MTTLEYRRGPMVKLYGDVHVHVDTLKHARVSLKACKIIGIWPPSTYSLEELERLPLAAVYPDDQPGKVLFHTPEVPKGEEVPTDMITIPSDAKVDIELPKDPD